MSIPGSNEPVIPNIVDPSFRISGVNLIAFNTIPLLTVKPPLGSKHRSLDVSFLITTSLSDAYILVTAS